MRAAAALLAVVLGGCWFGADSGAEAVDDDDSGDDGAEPFECVEAADCVLAASSCCECPSFAMPDSGLQDDCDVIECPDPSGCPAIAPACVDGTCTVACLAIECDATCAGGFASDAAGCLACACADGPPPSVECAVDDDCVRIPADCCGCERGGADRAAPAAIADDLVDTLMCPTDPACPDVDVCDPSAVPRCLAGTCVLAGAPMDGVVAECGRPDLPPCPDGTVCVLNADAEASSQGVGTCQPPA